MAAGPPQDTRQAECAVAGGGEVMAPATYKKDFERLILKLSVLLLVVMAPATYKKDSEKLILKVNVLLLVVGSL
ncbi:hypothetical protein PC123_g25636 [Phytophthora cactorum]|nr:hypothetical protein PC123_g25636 [Phytophthora cactorum]